MRFANRIEAAELLAEALAPYAAEHPLVLGIPRGAVPMARRIAQRLGGDLDVVLVKKIGAPGNPEFAIGSVSEDGSVWAHPSAPRSLIDRQDVQGRIGSLQRGLDEKRGVYTPFRSPILPTDRTVIVVDDGLATGLTMLAALRATRKHGPRRLVAACAVAPPSTLREIREEADDVVCLMAPESFVAVGQFFVDFGQVSDKEVIAALRQAEDPHEGREADEADEA